MLVPSNWLDLRRGLGNLTDWHP
ncbi:unnamed protein product [Ectocarpus sp. CCAP 1310/34]|nr:unnamed protein product [Ectocarpus sp. CCAP 1310/34]